MTTAYRHSLIGNHEIRQKHEILQQSLLIHATASSRHQRQRMSVNRVASQESHSTRLRSAPLRSAPLRPLATLRSTPPLQAQPHQPHPFVPLSSKILPPTTPLMQLEGDKSRHLLRPGFEVGQRKRSSLSDPLPLTSVNKQVFR